MLAEKIWERPQCQGEQRGFQSQSEEQAGPELLAALSEEQGGYGVEKSPGWSLR